MPDTQDNPESQPKEPTVAEQEFVEIPFPNFYSNSANVAQTFLDFAFTFMERIDPQHTSIKVRIVTPPVHAKLFLEALQTQMQKYEDKFGEIRIPESVRRKPTASSSESAPPSLQSETAEKA